MNKNWWIIAIIIICIIIYIMNNKNDLDTKSELKNNEIELDNIKNLKKINLIENIPLPDSLIFYYNGRVKEFTIGSDEFEKIILLNNQRETKKIEELKLVVDIQELIKNVDILEYNYKNYNSIYFNLVKENQIKEDNSAINWLLVGYDDNTFNQATYGGILPADKLLDYLNSLK